MIDIEQIILDFVRVAGLGGLDVKEKDIQIERLPAPHTPQPLYKKESRGR